MNTPRIIFYQDGRHPLIYAYEPPMQKEEYESAIDEIMGTPVDTLFFCLGEGRTMLHDTEVGELWGHNVNKWPHIIWRRAHQNAKNLIEEGNDPLRIICDRARKEKILIYPSLNVQWDSAEQGEGTIWVRVSDFRWNNKHLEIGASTDVDKSFPGYGCLDFKHEEVRNERFAIVEETVNKYDVDGFDLHLNNFPYYFNPNEIDDGLNIMTEWIGKVHRTVKKSGSARKLSIRVPNSIETCMSLGLDINEWIKQDIVDILIAQDKSYRVNQMANFRPFVEVAKESNCRIFAAIQSPVPSISPQNMETIAMTRATASNYWAQDIDGLFLDRGWFSDWPYQAPFYEKLRELPFPHLMEPKDKFYHLLTGTGRKEEDIRLEIAPTLPAILAEGKSALIDFTISDDLPKWDKVGRVYDVLLRIGISEVTELDQLSFKLNGKDLTKGNMRTINMMYRMGAPRNRQTSGYWFVFRPKRDQWPAKGENRLEIALVRRDPEVISTVSIGNIELETKYLMGRNFYRDDVDPDLGPYKTFVQ